MHSGPLNKTGGVFTADVAWNKKTADGADGAAPHLALLVSVPLYGASWFTEMTHCDTIYTLYYLCFS